MTDHLQDLELQICGQDVLWNIARDGGEDVVRMVLRGSGVQAVMAATRAHPESAELKQACSDWSLILETMNSEADVGDEAEDATTTPAESGQDECVSDSE